MAIEDNGRVTPKRDGRVLITVRSGYIEKVIPVHVEIYASIEPSARRLLLLEGQELDLTARIFAEDGSPIYGELTWTSKNPDVVTVDQNGHAAAKEAGTTKIIISAEGVSADIDVAVYPLISS